ncbi:hypothetical protein OSTOST_21942 [Ostertagia ostertagi]
MLETFPYWRASGINHTQGPACRMVSAKQKDPSARKIEVVVENPLPGLIPQKVRRASDAPTNVDEKQIHGETTVRRVKRKSGGKKALKNKKGKLNKGSATNP